MNDVEQLQIALGVVFQRLFVEPINILTFVTLLFIISWKLALIAIIIIPLAGIAIIGIGRSIRRKSRRTQKKIAEIMQILTETLSSIRIVKAFVNEKEEIKKFIKESEHYFKLLLKRGRLDLIAGPVTESFGVIIGVVLLWYGGTEVLLQKGLEPEDFIRFILILFSILGPIKQMSNVNLKIQTGAASAERIFMLLDTPPEIIQDSKPIELKKFKDSISFDQVHFEYHDSDDQVLDQLSFTINKGEVVAMVDPSGAGKSTIADLIPRFFDVSSGKIEIDGNDIRKLSLSSLRNKMGIVTQEVILFNDTIRNNPGLAKRFIRATMEAYAKAEKNPDAAVDAIAVSTIFMNTFLAGAGGVIGAAIITRLHFGKTDVIQMLNGCIGGLVAITAEPLMPSPIAAILIGAVGGVIVVFGTKLLFSMKIDDVVGAVPAHLFAGIWGTLAVPITNPDTNFGAQLLGVVSINVFVFIVSLIVWAIMKNTIGIRLSKEGELKGTDVTETGVIAYAIRD